MFVIFFSVTKNANLEIFVFNQNSQYTLDKLFVLLIKSGTNLFFFTVNSLIYQNVNKQMTQVFVYKTKNSRHYLPCNLTVDFEIVVNH